MENKFNDIAQMNSNTPLIEISLEYDGTPMKVYAKAEYAAYKKNVGKINVPGFRKGKATRKMIEAQYGENVFFEEAEGGYNESCPEYLHGSDHGRKRYWQGNGSYRYLECQ